jgi:hypothetical protein
VIAGAQAAKREVVRPEVVDTGVEVGERPAHDVDVDVVERAGASGGAKEDLAARILPVAQQTGGEEEEARERGTVERGPSAGSIPDPRARRAPDASTS